MARVLIATCARLPVDDEDQRLLLEALEVLGIPATPAIWDDPGIDWKGSDLVVLRSTWDYTTRREEFLSWVGSLDQVANPASAVAWNTDKHYLDDLAARGIPTIPTTYATSPAELVVPDADRFVIKPTVGAGSVGAALFAAEQLDEARAHLARLTGAGQIAMVQPYLADVEVHGETAVILIDESPSHAIAKAAMLTVTERERTVQFRAAAIEPRVASAAELELARLACQAAREGCAVDEPFLYARVDIIGSEEGLKVIELELTEPSLFLWAEPTASRRLAGAIAARL